MKPLITRYRPNSWDEVVGQNAAVDAIADAISNQDAQTFLFSGPSGTGKTTLAKIAAHQFGCDDHNILDLDAATYNGIDKMREVQDFARYTSLDGDGKKAIIIDEAHGLSRQSWDSLLKATEEPPVHIMWFFCTTNLAKVPKTIKTRSLHVELKPIKDDVLEGLVEDIAKSEKIKLKDGVLALIVREAQGSARQAITNLVACRNAKDRKDAASLLKTALETDPTLELCRFLAGKQTGSWAKVMGLVNRLEDENIEGTRIMIMNYMGAALKNSKSDADACHFLSRIEPFVSPYNTAEGIAPLLRSIGQVIFAE